MKTFSARYRGNRLVKLIADVHLAEDAKALVIVPEPEDAEEAMWSNLTAAQFLEDYSEADSVYDGL